MTKAQLNRIEDGMSLISLVLGVCLAVLLAREGFFTFFQFIIVMIGIQIISVYFNFKRRQRDGR